MHAARRRCGGAHQRSPVGRGEQGGQQPSHPPLGSCACPADRRLKRRSRAVAHRPGGTRCPSQGGPRPPRRCRPGGPQLPNQQRFRARRGSGRRPRRQRGGRWRTQAPLGPGQCPQRVRRGQDDRAEQPYALLPQACRRCRCLRDPSRVQPRLRARAPARGTTRRSRAGRSSKQTPQPTGYPAAPRDARV